MNNQFSENLKKIRKDNNLSQEQLADELGVSRQAISKWESGVAYPEMDKIISMCDKFNLNIDDLLHRDIREVKGEEESKSKINIYIAAFLKFITDTFNLFISMSFKSKVKCLLEQTIIIFILYVFSSILILILGSLYTSIFAFTPDKILYFIKNILDSIFRVLFLILSIAILVHIFKSRYLNYFKLSKNKIEKSDLSDETALSKKEKIEIKNNEEKIIIRDSKHSEYRLVSGILKLVILVIKFLLLWFAFFVSFILIGLVILFVVSFLICNTGLLFAGVVMSIVSSSTIAIIILLLIFNFIFNRKSNKKIMIWSFIFSIVLFGIGCGFVTIGSLDFKYVEDNSQMLKTETIEYDMKDNLVIYPYNNVEINYVETEDNDIKVEYALNKYCEINNHLNQDKNVIMSSISCKNPTRQIKEYLKLINQKKIIPIDIDISKVTVYTSSSNIEKLKNNLDSYTRSETIYTNNNLYSDEINELEEDLEVIENN